MCVKECAKEYVKELGIRTLTSYGLLTSEGKLPTSYGTEEYVALFYKRLGWFPLDYVLPEDCVDCLETNTDTERTQEGQEEQEDQELRKQRQATWTEEDRIQSMLSLLYRNWEEWLLAEKRPDGTMQFTSPYGSEFYRRQFLATEINF